MLSDVLTDNTYSSQDEVAKIPLLGLIVVYQIPLPKLSFGTNGNSNNTFFQSDLLF